MAIEVGNQVVLIDFPGRKTSAKLPYLFSIYAESGIVTAISGAITAVDWNNGEHIVVPVDKLVIYNSKEYKDLLQLFDSTGKFPMRSLVVLRDHPRSEPGIVIATDWDSHAVLVEWADSERQLYLDKNLMLFSASFDPNLAFKKHKNSKTVEKLRGFTKSAYVLEDDIPF